ncbi:MAG: hybrid sensor histidine kinase/response regulator [Alkalilacustris sp.]
MVTAEDGTAKLTRAGLNLIQQALSIYDSELRLANCNRRFQEMFDLPDWVVTPGARFEDTIRYLVQRGEYGPVDDLDAAVAQRVEAAQAFAPHYLERARPDGRWISVEGAPLPQGGWVTVYTDITEIKYQERLLRIRADELSAQLLADSQRLAQANRALAASNAALEEAKRELTEMEARTRLTTEMMPAHIAHLGPDLVYTYSNRRLSTLLPGRPSEIVGLHSRDALGADVFDRIEGRLHRALAGEASVFEVTHDDSGRRIRVALTPNPAGEGRGVYILSTDVTEEAQARAALAQTRKRELAAQLTSGLAHDFSNLLTIILGLQDRLARMPLPPEARDLVGATVAAARRGGRLLDRLAAISGPRVLRPGPVCLPAFLDELRTLAAPSLPGDMALGVACDAGLDRPLLLDPGALQDTLLNLILNARDAMGTRGQIALQARALRDTWVEITVADTGPGFSPEALAHAFDPFFTTKAGAGSGLGLAMVFDQTQLAGGTVRVSNRPEGGAQVVLRLPLRPTETAPARLVLLVEDSDEIRTGIREMLIAAGHSVLEASAADEALALAGLPEIDLVLSDINLPGDLSGLDLAERLAASGQRAELRLMTSLPPGAALRARAAARFPLIAKPFGAAELAAFLSPAQAA